MASSATAVASPNIAFVKYWGNRRHELNIPTRPSLSMTLAAPLTSQTTVAFDSSLKADSLELDGTPVVGDGLARAKSVLDAVRQAAQLKSFASVSSANSFPAGTGIASSASGFAALASAAWSAAGLKWDEQKVSLVARLGSGSACRSIPGGFVIWNPGYRADGSDCFARSFAPPSHWPELRDLVVVLDDRHKAHGSNAAMQASAKTSPLYASFVMEGERRVGRVRRYLMGKDLSPLLQEVMEESDLFHAVCESSSPALHYLGDASKAVQRAVRDYNAEMRGTPAGYTFDAGPNAHIITRAEHVEELKSRIQKAASVKAFFVSAAGPGAKIV